MGSPGGSSVIAAEWPSPQQCALRDRQQKAPDSVDEVYRVAVGLFPGRYASALGGGGEHGGAFQLLCWDARVQVGGRRGVKEPSTPYGSVC